MTCGKFLTAAALAAGLIIAAPGQVDAQQPGDEIDHLAQIVDLTEEQQQEMREVITELTPQIEELQLEAQGLQRELEEQVGPDFNERRIRETAAQFGEKVGELTALSAILQSNVAQIMTEEQRQILEEQARQQDQMQREFQEQLRQQQQQQQQQPSPQQP